MEGGTSALEEFRCEWDDEGVYFYQVQGTRKALDSQPITNINIIFGRIFSINRFNRLFKEAFNTNDSPPTRLTVMK